MTLELKEDLSGEISPTNLAISLCKFSAVLAQPVDNRHTMATGKTNRFILYPLQKRFM